MKYNTTLTTLNKTMFEKICDGGKFPLLQENILNYDLEINTDGDIFCNSTFIKEEAFLNLENALRDFHNQTQGKFKLSNIKKEERKEEEEKPVYISYRNAIKYFSNSYVSCNNITEIDDSIFYNDYNIVNDDFYDEEQEIFQYFITDCSESDAKYLNNFFGLQFLFSGKLDCYILPVFHFGTSWDYVPVEILDSEVAEHIKGTSLEYKE